MASIFGTGKVSTTKHISALEGTVKGVVALSVQEKCRPQRFEVPTAKRGFSSTVPTPLDTPSIFTSKNLSPIPLQGNCLVNEHKIIKLPLNIQSTPIIKTTVTWLFLHSLMWLRHLLINTPTFTKNGLHKYLSFMVKLDKIVSNICRVMWGKRILWAVCGQVKL